MPSVAAVLSSGALALAGLGVIVVTASGAVSGDGPLPVAASPAATDFPRPLVQPAAPPAAQSPAPSPSAGTGTPPALPIPTPSAGAGAGAPPPMPSLRPPGVLGDAASVTVTPSFPAEASPSTADPARPLRQGEDDLVARINAERASRSLPALTVDPGLLQLAAQWAATMPVDGYRHSPDERLRAIMSSEDLGVIGENIHAPEPQCSAGVPCTDIDLQPTSGVVAVDWMNSQTHRDNLLDPRWDRLGVSLFCDSSGRMWAAALFAGPVGSAPENPTAGEPAGRLADASNGGYTCTGDRRGNSATWKHPPAS